VDQLNDVPNEPHNQESGANGLADFDELALVGCSWSAFILSAERHTIQRIETDEMRREEKGYAYASGCGSQTASHRGGTPEGC
jgi:hypothetical protein